MLQDIGGKTSPLLRGDKGSTSEETTGRDMATVKEFTTDTVTSEPKSVTTPGKSTLTYMIIDQEQARITCNIPRSTGEVGTPSTARKDVASQPTRGRESPQLKSAQALSHSCRGTRGLWRKRGKLSQQGTRDSTG